MLGFDGRTASAQPTETGSGAVALLEFLLAAARAGIVATHFLQRIAHRLLGMTMVAVRAVDVVRMAMVVIVVVIAIGTVDVLVHLITPGCRRQARTVPGEKNGHCGRTANRSSPGHAGGN